MKDIDEQDEAMIYADKEVNIGALRNAYDTCLLDLEEYFEACLRSYDDRRNKWDGKSDDLRKQGANAFPWQGASDMEVNVIGERIDAFVSILDQALQRSHIKAFPTSHVQYATGSYRFGIPQVDALHLHSKLPPGDGTWGELPAGEGHHGHLCGLEAGIPHLQAVCKLAADCPVDA
jgi:hypothetical protein